jgi:hypothetical protein
MGDKVVDKFLLEVILVIINVRRVHVPLSLSYRSVLRLIVDERYAEQAGPEYGLREMLKIVKLYPCDRRVRL